MNTIQMNNIQVIYGDLKTQPQAPEANIFDIVNVEYVRLNGVSIAEFPRTLNDAVDRKNHTHVIVALTQDGKSGYVWDINDSENREHNCRRMRNALNLHAFRECDFYYVNTPSSRWPSNVAGDFCAFDSELYAPLQRRLREKHQEAERRG